MTEKEEKIFTPQMNQLKWACRRGMLELDVLLGNFLQHGYPLLTEKEKKTFTSLLTNSDPELFAWLMGHEEVVDQEEYKSLIQKIRAHAKYPI